MKYFILVGERSGDLHGASLINEIKSIDQDAKFFAWGGSYIRQTGAEVLVDYSTINYIGFSEVLINLFRLLGRLKECKRHIQEVKPDCLILIDSPGFNMRIAKYARKIGIRTVYYISPKIWAWNKSRVKLIKKVVDRMLVILPFEKNFYQEHSLEVDYVGNPVLDAVNNYQADQQFKAQFENKKVIAVLPGSRPSEVKNSIEVIERLVVVFEEYTFLVSAVDNLNQEFYKSLIRYENVHVVFGKVYDVLSVADAAVVTSGTATLETALLGVPQVVVYRTSLLTYLAAKWLLKVPYISLVNLLLGRKVVAELIQGEYDSANVVAELETLLTDEQAKKRISDGYSEIRKILGQKSASKNAAKIIVDLSRS